MRRAAAACAAAMVVGSCASNADSRSDASVSTTTVAAATSSTTPLDRLSAACSDRSRHVLVVGIDGLRADALQAATTPAIDAVTSQGVSTMAAYAGGETGTATEQPTLSGPGWSSILTGVWTDSHGVVDNQFGGRDFETYPHFFTRIRQVQPDARLASFVAWIPINVIVTDADVSAFGDDDTVAQDAVVELNDNDPTVVFVHLDAVDYAGHATGFGPDLPDYIAAIEGVDALVGQMEAAIDARESRESECWATVVVTDHGGTGTVHGGQTPEERTIPLIVGGDGLEGESLDAGPGHAAVPPTVLAYLGLEVMPEWGWAEQPFGVPPA